MAHAVAQGGITHIEITWNSIRPAELVAALRAELPTCWIGAGTLLNATDVQDAIAAGAQFLFSPHTQPSLIEQAVSQSVPMVPGALSPSEIVTAWQAGAACVKVFPIQAMGGPVYLRSLRGPLGQIPLIPTGGVTVENAADFLAAGAVAVGLSSDLFPKSAIAAGNWDAVQARSRQLCNQIKAGSSGSP